MRESNETYTQLVATYEKKFNKSPWALQCPIRCNIKHSFDNFETFSDKIIFNLRLVETRLKLNEHKTFLWLLWRYMNVLRSFDLGDTVHAKYIF